MLFRESRDDNRDTFREEIGVAEYVAVGFEDVCPKVGAIVVVLTRKSCEGGAGEVCARGY